MKALSRPAAYTRLLPGLALVAVITTLAYLSDKLPVLGLLGALGLALLLGLVWRALFGLAAAVEPGATFSAKTLLNLGVILLGVRLDFALMFRAGPVVLLLDLLVVTIGVLTIERLGKWMGLSRGLRLALAVGSSICGPSAIAAAVPIIKANDDEVSLSIGIVSLLGAVGAVGFILLGSPLGLRSEAYGLMTGATLQSVGHVLVAGAAQGAAVLDLATLTKLTRVALLAPVLLVMGWLLARRDAATGNAVSTNGAATKGKRPPLLPGFLVGFLALGAVNSLGLIPPPLAAGLSEASLLLTTAAMAGIGLKVDFSVLRRVGGGALGLALLGFGIILSVAALYTTFMTG